MDESLKKNAVSVARRIIEQRGCTIIDEIQGEGSVIADLVAMEEEKKVLVFVAVSAGDAEEPGFPETSVEDARGLMERTAIRWLAAQEDFAGSGVRFDTIDLKVVGPSRAFVRYCRDAFSR